MSLNIKSYFGMKKLFGTIYAYFKELGSLTPIAFVTAFLPMLGRRKFQFSRSPGIIGALIAVSIVASFPFPPRNKIEN